MPVHSYRGNPESAEANPENGENVVRNNVPTRRRRRRRRNAANRETNPEQPEAVVRNKRMYGEFRCTCGRRWMSACVWVDFGQQCRKCKTMLDPYYICELRRSETLNLNKSNINKSHEQQLCGKCTALGRPCWLKYGSVSK